jgi:hypothetical protein
MPGTELGAAHEAACDGASVMKENSTNLADITRLAAVKRGIGATLLAVTAFAIVPPPALAQSTATEVKPFLHIPAAVSPEFQAFLRMQTDPALKPRFPDPSDLAAIMHHAERF